MVRTQNKKETINFLWEVSQRKSECKDNHFFISKDGWIVGHGYLQGNGDYFPKYPKDMALDIFVPKGMKNKDIIQQINTAMNED